jgi:hypothetical protein
LGTGGLSFLWNLGMTDTVLTTLIVQGTTAALALGGWLQSWRNNRRMKAQTVQLDGQSEKLTEIHTLTNSNLQEVRAQLTAANQAIKLSDQRLADLQVVVTRLLAEKVQPASPKSSSQSS